MQRKFETTCMTAPLSTLRQAADEMGIEYVTLDTKENRLKVCKEMSLHVRDTFTKEGICPNIKELLLKQEEEAKRARK